jgi:hypothetical protein
LNIKINLILNRTLPISETYIEKRETVDSRFYKSGQKLSPFNSKVKSKPDANQFDRMLRVHPNIPKLRTGCIQIASKNEETKKHATNTHVPQAPQGCIDAAINTEEGTYGN